jgi:UV DNA damage endonuclease
MRIGYPCINITIGCKADHTFRLQSYSEERLIATVAENLACLQQILAFNLRHELLFFRITSDLVPFASHPVNQFEWQAHFQPHFREIGQFITEHGIRISMHPDQFTLINTLDTAVFERSVKELEYHAEVLDLLRLDTTAKIQLHVGGIYGDKAKSMQRFIERFETLDERLRSRLVIENDDRLYTLRDCLHIHAETSIPVLFDVFHHGVNSSGETVRDALAIVAPTWTERDGVPMLDYSSQEPGERAGKHAETIDLAHFKRFLEAVSDVRVACDLMLEIKDKEKSAVKVVAMLKELGFVTFY